MVAIACFASVMLDAWLGEPRRAHPLVGFGRLANALEQTLNRGAAGRRRVTGVIAVVILVLPLVSAAAFLEHSAQYGFFVSVIVLYLAIGLSSLAEHGRDVALALEQPDLNIGRERVQRMVSRDTAALDAEGVSKAAVESVLENGNDAVFGALFWFVVAGGPGVVLYRLVNTLDAMWGYRSERYLAFGWAAARVDDVLNWLPARLTAMTYALLGDTARAWHCWRTQGGLTESPNAGRVMAAGAGALGIEAGGSAVYHGVATERPVLGAGRAPSAADIERAVRLVRNGTWLWLGILLLGEYFIA